MSVRYLVLAGALTQAMTAQVERRLESQGMRLCASLSTTSFALFVDEQLTPIKLGAAAIVLGHAFEADGRPISQGGERLAAAVAEGGLSVLTDQIWGPYIAFAADDERQAEIMRDPSGGVSCYFVRSAGVVFATSDVECLTVAAGLHPQIDWEAVKGHLIAFGLRPSRTCLEGIEEVLSGELMRVGRDGNVTRRCAWSPWQHAGTDRQFSQRDQAVAALRDAVLKAVGALCADVRHAVLGVSGGLDSSIVAACLDACRRPFSAMTIVGSDPRGDEREFTNLLADALELKIIECFRQDDSVVLLHSEADHLPRPTARAFAQSSSSLFQKVADMVNGDAYFSGGGGDHIFCSMQNVLPVVDRYRAGGISAGLMRTIVDVAMVTGVSVFEVIYRGVQRNYSRRKGYRWPLLTQYLSRDMEIDDTFVAHPWLEAEPGALPGKAVHIAWLMHVQNHLEGHGKRSSLPTRWPLLAQPVVETCLRIPTWMWFTGGRDRAVARDAFAPMLPEGIVRRRSKGTPDGFIAGLVETRRGQIRDLLLDGMLRQAGLLDHRALEIALNGKTLLTTPESSRIMTLVDVESWTRAWQQRTGPDRQGLGSFTGR